MGVSVSVALCTYNGAQFIGEQLSSILEQVPAPAEIVVSDDGSRDDTLERVQHVVSDSRVSTDSPVSSDSHASMDSGGSGTVIRVLRNPVALGVTANFEQALTTSTGDIVVLSDQDDIWHPGRLAQLTNRFTDPSIDLVFTDARIVDADGGYRGYDLFHTLEISDSDLAAIRSGDAFGVLLRRNLVTGATAAVRRQLIDRASPFPAEWVHDEWLAIIAAATGRIDVIQEPTIDYRQHGANQIGVTAPSLSVKIRRVLMRRGDRNRLLAVRSRVLAERLAALPGVSSAHLAEARAKAEFEKSRAALPANRVKRIRPVLAAHSSGLYRRFASQGAADVVRDLLQPS